MTAPVLIAPEAIPMTAPVLVAGGGEAAGDTMSFVLPASKYSKVEDAPVPTNPNIKLQQLPERVQAVRAFTWSFRAVSPPSSKLASHPSRALPACGRAAAPLPRGFAGSGT
jgi:hypothetical protein